MAFVSELLGKMAVDASGQPVGRLEDLLAGQRGAVKHPQIVALALKDKRRRVLIAYADVVDLLAPELRLKKALAECVPYTPAEQDLFLARDVLDKQIIDTDGVRVVRVNDLELRGVNGWAFVANVDIGGLGLMRRLGLGKPSEKVADRLGRKGPASMIPWDSIELLSASQPMRLKVPSSKLADLHPADLAEIISDMSGSESRRFLESMDVETAADTLEEVEPDFQASLVQELSDEKVADLLEEMAPDEAADLLAELPEDRSQDLLELMEYEDAQDVRKLLAYPEDSAGGIMTTEYIAVPPHFTAEQAIEHLREAAGEAETFFYIYVTDKANRLLGVFSLQDLVLARPETPVTDFMHRRLVTLNAQASQDEAAQVVAKYNLLAVPVVDEEDRLHGIVTADDALDKIIPTAWKKRLPRMYR
jgi:magnesium transporter